MSDTTVSYPCGCTASSNGTEAPPNYCSEHAKETIREHIKRLETERDNLIERVERAEAELIRTQSAYNAACREATKAKNELAHLIYLTEAKGGDRKEERNGI